MISDYFSDYLLLGFLELFVLVRDRRTDRRVEYATGLLTGRAYNDEFVI